MTNFDLDTTLLDLTNNQQPLYWTARHAMEGVQIFGGIGSGKTSGSGRTLALKYLSAGFGGLVLTAKPDEKLLWQEYCSLSGRKKDFLVVEPGGKHAFNFLEYESTQASGGNAFTENIVQVLKTVIKASEEKSTGKTNDPFWDSALDLLLFNVIDLCKLAYDQIDIHKMYAIVQSIPKEGKRDENSEFFTACLAAKKRVDDQIEVWQSNQSTEILIEAYKDPVEILKNALPDYRTLMLVDEFFGETYGPLSEKTRSIIDFSFSSFLFRLLREPIYSLFCSKPSTFTPNDTLDGKIILVNLPVKLYQKIGRDMQIMFKYIWQRTMEKRNIKENERPVFLWADEAQNFLHEHDPEYQATARSSRIATVYLSQNLPNYLANMGGDKFTQKVQSFLGTLRTKIFHANADVVTNSYASDLIGDGPYRDTSQTKSFFGMFNSSKTESLKIDKLVRPEEFAGLRTGGPLNHFKVQAYIHIQGNTLKETSNYLPLVFDQNYTPSS